MYITANVPITEIGSARLGMSVADTLRRNRKITSDDEEQRQHERELHVVPPTRGSSPRGRTSASMLTLGRNLRLQLRHQRLHRVGDGDGVRAGLALDGEDDAARRR